MRYIKFLKVHEPYNFVITWISIKMMELEISNFI